MKTTKKEQRHFKDMFKKINRDIENGEKHRSHFGVEPKNLVEKIKKELCQQFIKYKTSHNLSNCEIAKLLDVTESQSSKITAYHWNYFTIDFLVEKLEILAKTDIEIKKTSNRILSSF